MKGQVQRLHNVWGHRVQAPLPRKDLLPPEPGVTDIRLWEEGLPP